MSAGGQRVGKANDELQLFSCFHSAAAPWPRIPVSSVGVGWAPRQPPITARDVAGCWKFRGVENAEVSVIWSGMNAAIVNQGG
jgi:hypothetical protein